MECVHKLPEFKEYILNLQTTICEQLASIDKKKTFSKEVWESDIGTGITRVIEGGNVFEKGGVNVSHVIGERLPEVATSKRPEIANTPFEATGLSLVIHPQSPLVPTVHMNIRLFTLTEPPYTWWFGGGYDLTPYIPFEEDCISWHEVARDACTPFGEKVYEQYKKWADDYFYLKHRKENRGIGGLFFDDLNQWDYETSCNFTKGVGSSFLDAYLPIVKKRMHEEYSEQQKSFQLYRRGRYVEFNLIYDRGTLFGLKFGGRIESILMSLPPMVCWDNYTKYEKEQKRLLQFLNHKNWTEKKLA